MDDFNAASWRELLSQHHRFITLQTALPDALLVERMQGVEALNQELDFTLECVSVQPWLDIDALIDRTINLQLIQADGRLRLWQGMVIEVEQQDSDGGLTDYRLRVATWLSLLKQRRNTLIFQDMDVLGIVGRVFADYPQAQWRHAVTQPLVPRPICTQYRETDFEFVTRVLSEEGLSFRFEHAETPLLDADGLPTGSATLVIFDRYSPWPEGQSLPFTRIHATEAGDGINHFSEQLNVCSDSTSTSRWNPALMNAISGRAHHNPASDASVLPTRELFDAQPPLLFTTDQQADLWAELLLDAARLKAHLYQGEGAIRQLQPGPRYTLTGHVNHHNQDFICLSVAHHAVNNLGAALAHRRRESRLEAGSYRNRFTAIPATVPVVSTLLPRPLASGVQSAIVVGATKQAITSTRDHQVRVQFPWQRGDQPLLGGLFAPDNDTSSVGHAPGNQSSGTWVRVAEDAVGNNFGQHFTPRIGAEVLIGFADGDIDQPTITGQLYGGHDAPPFASGVDSKSNHPGTLSGLHTRNLDGSTASQWLLDDASGQSRHALHNATADSQLALGYLIEQQGAERGAYLGQGFDTATNGWGQVRAEQGLLLSASRRKDGVSTQMDMSEAHAQLQGAVDTAEHLNQAAQGAEAGTLSANPAQRTLTAQLDPQKGAHHSPQVNGQKASQPSANQRDGGDPVPCFSEPHIVLETPSHLIMTTPNSSTAHAGEYLHITAQQDGQFSARHTLAGVTGDSLNLFTAEGGAKVISQHGNVSLHAHSSALEIIADQDLTLNAADDRIELIAKDRIVLQSGTSSITLQGTNITVVCDGAFTVRGGEHPIMGGAITAPDMPILPNGVESPVLKLGYRYHDQSPVAGAPYTVHFSNGQTLTGTLDEQGQARVENPPPFPSKVEYADTGRETPDDFTPSLTNSLFGKAVQESTEALSSLEILSNTEQAHLEDQLFDDEIAAMNAQQSVQDHDGFLEYQLPSEEDSAATHYPADHPVPRPQKDTEQ